MNWKKVDVNTWINIQFDFTRNISIFNKEKAILYKYIFSVENSYHV
jgi:hypothetical protein